MTPPKRKPLTKTEFEALSEFRFQIRRFERFSEDVVQAAGITPLQYLLLLHIKGFPGRTFATVGELAHRLQAKPHGVVALVTRCEEHGFVERRPSAQDRRRVEIHLLPEGERLLGHLAELHRTELQSLGAVFSVPNVSQPVERRTPYRYRRHGRRLRAHDERRDFAAATRLPAIAAIAAGVGGLSTLAAWALLHLIRLFTNLFFFQAWSDRAVSPATNTLGLAVIAVPPIGGLAIGLMARFGSEAIRGHGIPEAIEAILFNKSRMSPKVAVLKPISSGIAIGSGGPFGAEGPIIMTGGALGSLVGQFFRITGGERKTLLVAGAVAGMTAVFGTPIAAVMLAVELLLFELRPRSLLPVAVACCVAAALRPLVLDGGPLFPLPGAAPDLKTLASCVAAGLAAGALSWVVSTSLYKVEDLIGRLPLHWMWWPALGGLVVGLGGWLQPRALGVGYDVIGDLLANRLALDGVLALIVCKALMWVVALASGTSGGVLAPLLTMGAALGVLAGPYLPGGQPALWPLVFMAATLGGMMRAPLMAAMFALELTHDVEALLPLLVATAVACGFTVMTMPRSILTEKISRRGRHIYREYGIDPLERHIVSEVMSRDVQTLDGEATLAGALARDFGSSQRHRAFPVLVGGRFIGMVDREALLAGLQRPGIGRVADLFGANVPAMALPDENCRLIATRLAVHGLERLPVVTDARTRRLVGIVTRSDLVKPSLAIGDEEHLAERFLALPLAAARARFRALTGAGPGPGGDRSGD